MVWRDVRRTLRYGVFALGVLLPARSDGQAQAAAQHETFTARTVNMRVGAGQDVKIDVFRWSTGDERAALLSAFKENDKVFVDAMQKAPSLGSIWTSESLGYTIRYARADKLPNGTERVVVLTDRRLGSWSGQPWKPLRAAGAPDSPFSLIELRLNGAGEGKLSIAGKVAADDTATTLFLADYDAAPILLRPVKREVSSPK